MGGVLIILWIIISALVYIPLGVFLLLRANRKAIRSRSPLLVIIAHCSNFFESFLLLLSLYLYFTKSEQNHSFDTFYQLMIIIVHYSFFIAYMLRCYRVNFIFNLDSKWDNDDGYFKQNIHRAGQKWLIKIFLICLWPVLIVATLRIAISGADTYFPPSYYDDVGEGSDVSEGIYLFILFLEELGFVFAVYKLRKVQDDFKMTTELTIVCVLWVLTGFFSIFTESWIWRLQVIIRNHLIMLISSLIPLIKTLTPESFEEVITIEMLQSLELVLQSSVTLNAFEKSLQRSQSKSGVDSLQLWLKCEYYRHFKTDEVEKDIMSTAKSLKISALSPFSIQSEVFHSLNVKFFPEFKESEEYNELLKEINRQQIYLHRIMQTSLVGDSTEIHISNV